MDAIAYFGHHLFGLTRTKAHVVAIVTHDSIEVRSSIQEVEYVVKKRFDLIYLRQDGEKRLVELCFVFRIHFFSGEEHMRVHEVSRVTSYAR